MMISCQEASRLAMLRSEQPLKWSEKLALAFHLMLCGHCRRANKQLNLIRQLLHLKPLDLSAQDENYHLSLEKKEEIKRKLAC